MKADVNGMAGAKTTMFGMKLAIIRKNPSWKPTVKLFVCCLVDSEWAATHIVDRLYSQEFVSDEISVLFPTRSRSESAGLNADMAGGGLDQVLGGFRAFHFPMQGLLFGAGPIMSAFVEPNRPFVEDLSIPLRRFGISANRAQSYAQQLVHGDILLAIHSAELHRAKRAEQIFFRAGARNIAYSGSLIPLSPPGDAPDAMWSRH